MTDRTARCADFRWMRRRRADTPKKAAAPSVSVDMPVPDSQGAAPSPVSEDAPVPAVDSPVDSAPAAPLIGDISEYKSRREFKQLLFIAEQYIGRTLSPSDVETLTYFYDTLQFSVELTEYLIEYCVENGHRSMHYIKSVALAWADAGIRTVSEARRSASFYNKDCTAVLKAFGITGRMAAPVETELVKKWTGAVRLLPLILLWRHAAGPFPPSISQVLNTRTRS